MEIASKYSPEEVEQKWYDYWMEHNLFASKPDGRKPYTMVIPPPNVTGVLHMGHMLNNTIQDILVRRARMKGFNACWVPGTDHASIATEAKVVAKLAAQGINKHDLDREAFLEHAWQWTEEHGGIILEQLKRLGASCDWSRTAFTMDEERSESVIDVFVDLHKKGYIYRGVRVVNWDPKALTALSDEEVVFKETNGKLFYLKYFVEGESDKYIVVATTRPETIMGDTAVCVNPNDERYLWLHGKRLIIPGVNRSVPVITDEYVDLEFGTGCLKVTPAHDINDYMLGQKHQLDSIDILQDNGVLNEHGGKYAGMDRFEVRKQIMEDLQALGLVEKIEDYVNKVGYSERTDVPIEPKLSMQWFLKMDELAKPALDAVMNDEVKLHPAKFKNTYRHWMENVKDWCISRQLWWGHRIPAYYLPNGEYVVAASLDEALEEVRKISGFEGITADQLQAEGDCLDTWFSSWLWPMSVFDGVIKPKGEELKYYYPTSDLVTAPDILFFWVARMIIAGYEYMGQRPFENVYLTGIVRDAEGRKMSKSLGNSPDPIGLMQKYGADGVRVGLMMAAPAGNDVLYDESLSEQGRNFCNKIWNAFRLVKGWEVDETIAQPESSRLAIQWFSSRLQEAKVEIDDLFSKYRISEALTCVYKLFWDDFSSWYLEVLKPVYGQPIDASSLKSTLVYFDQLLRLLHPFMPFITEELWQALEPRKQGESIMTSLQGEAESFDAQLIAGFENMQAIVTAVRNLRTEKNIPFKEPLQLEVTAQHDHSLDSIVSKVCNLSAISEVNEKTAGAVSFLVGTLEYAVPVGNLIDIDAELTKLQGELEYQQKFLSSVLKKLSNESFVSRAPEKVIALEEKKRADAESRIATLSESIAQLQKLQ